MKKLLGVFGAISLTSVGLINVSTNINENINLKNDKNLTNFSNTKEKWINVPLDQKNNIENKEGSYSSWSSKREADLHTTWIETYSSVLGSKNELLSKYSLVRVSMSIKIGIYEDNGSSYNYYKGILYMETPLSELNFDSSILNEPWKKSQQTIVIDGWTNPTNVGVSSKREGSFTFNHTVGGNYEKWVFVNVGVYWDKGGELAIKHNGHFSFRNASLSKKYINTYRYVNSVSLL